MRQLLFSRTIDDLINGAQLWRIWLLLGCQDIRLRYRRSVLGPFWLTLSMALMVYTMGFLYGNLFNVDFSVYYPYLAAGLITWSTLATVISESVDAFSVNAHFIKQIKLPYTVYILRLIIKNNIIFFHNLLVIIPIIIFFHVPITPLCFVLLCCNLLLINLCGFSYVYILCLLGTRFQDFKQITLSLIQILFLLTPIMWMPWMIPERWRFLIDYNPIYQLLNLIREPLIGQIPSSFTYLYIAVFGFIGFTMMLLLLLRCRHRIAFWV